MSAVAEPLTHRAARELGERGQHLVWKSHGRWRFKGVPQPQQIFEVGEPGITPLRAPPHGPKAWRDIPLWRRPAALAAELALVAVVGFGVWFTTRPQPAIAFNQRDWVVLADLRNLTDQPLLDDSLEQAFRISLEQSRHVNVLSDLKTRDTLARMQRAPDTELDRATASEVALREGARAVILPTVAEVGGRLRVSAEVIDPHTETTVYAEHADGRGAETALSSIDSVTVSLRQKLGEELQAIEEDSAPLPRVTTSNLEALRMYARGQKAYAQNEFSKAKEFYKHATELDPQFALAWLGQVRVDFSTQDLVAAEVPLLRAKALRSRLTARDALYLEAWVAWLQEPSTVLDRWMKLATLYPDYLPAQANAAMFLLTQNRFDDAVPFARRAAAPQSEIANRGHDALGRALLGTEQYSSAAKAFDRALKDGYSATMRRRVAVDAAQRQYDQVDARLGKADPSDTFVSLERISVAVDRAEWGAARREAKRMAAASSGEGFVGRVFLLTAAVTSWLADDPESAKKYANDTVRNSLAAFHEGSNPNVDDLGLAVSAALFAQRLGDRSLPRKVLAVLDDFPKLTGFPVLLELTTVLRAENARLAGEPDKAIQALTPLLGGHEQYQTHAALLSAYVASGENNLALEQARWLQNHRGLAYIELGFGQGLQALNVADSNLALLSEAELLMRTGRREEAQRPLREFDQLWPIGTLPSHLRVRREALSDASNKGLM